MGRNKSHHLQRLKFDEEWRSTAKPPYILRLDRRQLFCLYHPWESSKAGRYAKIERTVTIPADWQPPFLLHFYCTDDYHADGYRVSPDSWLGQISLLGHRFKQVLVNNAVLWEVDVADAEGPEVPKNFTLDLTPSVKSGKPFRLAFRVIDKVASGERLPMDCRHLGATERDAVRESDPWKFMTHVYVGDVVITDGTCQESVVGHRPSALLVEQRLARADPKGARLTARRSRRLSPLSSKPLVASHLRAFPLPAEFLCPKAR